MGWNVGLSSLVRSREVGAITFFKIMPVVFQAVCTRLGARLGRRFPLVSCQLLGDRCSLRSLPLLLADCLLLLLPADCLLWLPADCLPPPPGTATVLHWVLHWVGEFGHSVFPI